MKRIISFNIVTIVTLLVLFCAALYLLLDGNQFHASISSIISHSHQLGVVKHIVVLALLPVYIATVIFGTAILGIYLGTTLQQLLVKYLQQPMLMPKKTF